VRIAVLSVVVKNPAAKTTGLPLLPEDKNFPEKGSGAALKKIAGSPFSAFLPCFLPTPPHRPLDAGNKGRRNAPPASLKETAFYKKGWLASAW
jgi:hypothetical protein